MTIGWNVFPVFALAAALSASAGALVAFRSRVRSRGAVLLTLAAVLVLAFFIGGMWMTLQRPPLRTMGETRLWYSFFMLVAGLFTYLRWHYRRILSFSTLMAVVFLVINWLRPEIHDQSLMPALQSIWFIPHVTVYMFSYSILGCSFLVALHGLFVRKTDTLHVADRLVYIGLAFLTAGMLTGALWAKEAWGHYWNWDPKEAWAAVTWMCYLLYIHLRLSGKGTVRLQCIVLILAFLALQMCWYGVNYLPTAQQSIHIYNR